MKISTTGLAAALLAVSFSVTLQALPASAAGFATGSTLTAAGATSAMPVDWHGHGREGWGWGGGGGIGLGIIGGIIGGILIADAIRENRADRGAIHACARDFPEFNPRTGTFVDNYGHVRVCPYLN